MEQTKSISTLPEGWIWTTIGEILVFEYGKALPQSERVQSGKYPVYGSNGKVGFHSDFLIDGPVIIIGRKGSVGAIHLENNKCWPIDTTYFIVKAKSLNQKFIYYLLKSLRLEKLDSSTAIPGINRNSVYELKIPLPPLDEQHRIVARIEELFSELDHAEDELKKAQKKLEVYKQALLKSAFEGKFTKGNHQEKRWRQIKFTELCEIQRGFDLPLSNIVKGRYPVMTSGGLNGYHNEHKAEGPCLIIGRSGSVGNVHYLDVDYFWPHNTTLFVKNFKNNNPKFVYYLFLQFNFKSFSSSTAVPTLDRKQFYNQIVSIPDLEEQIEVVEIIESQFALVENLESTIKKTLDKIAFSRQSILKQAFIGNLVPQNSHDESVLELIKQIREERQVYFEKLKLDEKEKPKRRAPMEKSNLSVKEVLQKQTEAISAKQIWKLSKFQDDSNIDLFYAELKELEESILMKAKGRETLITWKNENQ
ncbi:restriction endonuclease subunit S [Gaoshiqia sp. Z1-71]|uniref:restriction endonuclease subunit S n=1 Tax=Gaoshiqia hydrogeniformans TaxID=3290090 RepID=UPI003BF81C94